MKNLIPFSLAMSMATAGILHYVSPGKALTWTFSYKSNPLGFNHGTQSGTFEAPGSEIDGTHSITQFNFNHTVEGAASFDAPNPPSVFSTTGGFTNEITISGGAVTAVRLLVNNTTAPSSISIDFSNDPLFDAVDIYNNIDRGGSKLDETGFGGAINFSPQSGAGAPYEHNPTPALLIISIGFAIKKLSQKLRDKKNRDSSRNGDAK